MADEAYRAVFLRVHPTGKMVLSLTTESDGREAEYAELVARELGVPPSRVSVVRGARSRDKLLSIQGVETGELRRSLGIGA
jgi:CO/xanthine dehydrogenase Mo-binding subunit